MSDRYIFEQLARGCAKFPQSEPLTAGFDPARLARLNDFLTGCVSTPQVAGLNAVIVRNEQLAYAASIGHADQETRQPMLADSIFRIFSLTKPVVSAAAMRLLEAGRLLLTDPVREFLPEIGEMPVYAGGPADAPNLDAQSQDMTIADLMSHTSGLTYGADSGHPVDQTWNAARLFRRDEPMSEVIERLKPLPLKFQPGEQFDYGISHDILGVLLERIECKSLGNILKDEIFEPLEMSDTGFDVSSSKIERLTALYRPDGDDGLAIEDPASSKSRWAAPTIFEAGGQGLVSTIADFYRFLSMLLHHGETPNGRLLSRKSVELMTANRLDEEQRKGMWMPGYGFGLGLGVLLDPSQNANLGSIGEYTWAGSASTFFWVDPQENLIAILFAQLEPSSSHTIARRFKALMYQALI